MDRQYIKKYINMALMVIITIFNVFGHAEPVKESNLYPSLFKVIDLLEADNVVVMADDEGNIWEMEDIETWEIGDYMAVVMNDNGTKEIEDDTIVSVRYIHDWELK